LSASRTQILESDQEFIIPDIKKTVGCLTMESRFVRVRCQKCKNEQIIFGKASSKVKCIVCGATVADSSGGKSKIKARILEILN